MKSVLFFVLMGLIEAYVLGSTNDFRHYTPIVSASDIKDTTANPLKMSPGAIDSQNVVDAYIAHWNDTITFKSLDRWLYKNATADKYDTLRSIMYPVVRAYLNQCYYRDTKVIFKK